MAHPPTTVLFAGFTLPFHTAELLEKIPEQVWAPALDADGEVRDGAWVAELTGLLDLSGWPAGLRLVIRNGGGNFGVVTEFEFLLYPGVVSHTGIGSLTLGGGSRSEPLI